MTNHELAAILLAQPELPMYFVSTDPTDWTYKFRIQDEDVSIDDEFYPDEDDDMETNEEGYAQVSTITIDI